MTKSTDDIAFQNASAGIITASRFVGELVGVVTATDFFVSGIATFASDVGIAGTLTYEDVTNIDSVGIITARSNILVGSGITLSPDGDVFATGISTFSEGFAGDVIIDDKITHRTDLDTAIRFPSGNVISFETGGSEQVRITGNNRLLVGTDTPRQTRSGNASFQPDIQLESEIGSLSLGKFIDSTGPARLILQKARGSQSSPTIVQDNDELGSVTWSGWDGDTFTNAAQVRSEVDGTPGDDSMPGAITFFTTAVGSATPAERVRITSRGQLFVGVATDGGSTDNKMIIEDSGTTIFKINNTDDGTAQITLANTGSSNGQIKQISGDMYFSITGNDKLIVKQNGVIDVKEGQINLTKQGSSNFLKVGNGQNANNYAYIDFIGDDTYTGYGLRLLRGTGGANTLSQLIHRGTGDLNIITQEAAPILFKTTDAERLRITSGGIVLVGATDPRSVNSRYASLQVQGTTGGSSALSIIRSSNNSY